MDLSPPPYTITSATPNDVPNTLRWHPKVTPYRLFVLFSTFAFGTAKSVLSYHGYTIASVTIEWIMGVVMFLTFFTAGYYDSEGCSNVYFSWIFKFDCMDIVWRLLAVFSIQRPDYNSEERRPEPPPVAPRYRAPPPITGYRILVSSTVFFFGMLKAALGYLGWSTATNYIDWALAVAATSLLYCIGLYENNAYNLWPYFFADDHSSPVGRVISVVSYTMLYTVGLCISVIWTSFFSALFVKFWNETIDLSGNQDDGSPSNIRPTFIDGAHDITLKIMVLLFGAVYIIIGVACIILMLWLINRALRPFNKARQLMRPLRRRFLLQTKDVLDIWVIKPADIPFGDTIRRLFRRIQDRNPWDIRNDPRYLGGRASQPSVPNAPSIINQLLNAVILIAWVCLVILIHLMALVVCLGGLILCIGFPIRFAQPSQSIENERTRMILFFAILPAYSIFFVGAGGTIYAAFLVLKSCGRALYLLLVSGAE
ncbi:hypothetical protein B0H34DRAFT_862281 [Crassisporium funariophilum]|nr:hypothetical protein B0H34DRAFT_862281 [Crassisporium funariophilum]